MVNIKESNAARSSVTTPIIVTATKYLYPSQPLNRSEKQRPYTCVECNKSFTQKHVLEDHFRIHTGEKPFGCDICKKSFRQKNNLKRHMRCHL